MGIGSGIAALVAIPLVVYAVNHFNLQSAMNDVLSRPGNTGIDVSVHYGGYLDGNTLVYDLKSVSEGHSMADVFRVFLQFAEKIQSKEFDTVKLCFRGDERFQIDGGYFQTLGREFAHQNVIYTIRTFPEHLRTPGGLEAFPPRMGGWLYVMGKQMEDFTAFHRRWYVDDLGSSLELGSPSPNYEEDVPSFSRSRATVPPVVTYDEYARIEDGMSYYEVVDIVGAAGKEGVRSHVDGQGVIPDITTVSYSWQNEDGSNMIAMFQNGRLITKAQAGLK